jgi:hypothetical protein
MSLYRWLPTFLAFPLGGLLAIEIVGGLDGRLAGAAGGAISGAVLGLAQWLALRPYGVGRDWIAVTSAATAVGMFMAAAVTGAGARVVDVVVIGAIAGSVVGAAQSGLLTRSREAAAAWTVVTAAAWAVGWLMTSQVIVDLDRGHHVFGSSGAIVATLLTGLALRRLRPVATTTAAGA